MMNPNPYSARAGTRLVPAMCAAQLLAATGLGVYPALLPHLSALWSMSGAQAGLVGAMVYFGYVAATPFLSSRTDRVDSRQVYFGSAILAISGLLFFAILADGFIGALLGQALLGIGFAGLYMPGLKALTDRLDEDRRSRASAIYSSMQGAGLALSYALAPVLAATIGWRWAFGASAVAVVSALTLAYAVLTPKAPPVTTARPSLLESFRRVRANHAAVAYVVAYAAHCWELFAFRAWLVAFLAFVARTTGDSTASNAWVGTIAGAVAILGIGSSILANEFAGRLGRVRLLLVLLSGTLAIGLALALSWQTSFVVAATLACLHYLGAMSDAGALNAGVIEASASAERGATLAVYSTTGYLAGFAGPAAVGLVLDAAGGQTSSIAWTLALLTTVAPNMIAFVVLRRQGAVQMSTPSAAAVRP